MTEAFKCRIVPSETFAVILTRRLAKKLLDDTPKRVTSGWVD
jgi:hypothetical protein